jgi:hypothetical protein
MGENGEDGRAEAENGVGRFKGEMKDERCCRSVFDNAFV